MKRFKHLLINSPFFISVVIGFTDLQAQVSANCMNITVNLTSTGNATITGTDVDNGSTKDAGCSTSGIASYVVSPSGFTCSNVASQVTVTLTVTDSCSNTGSCVATVTVKDNIVPTAKCKDITILLDNKGLQTLSAADIDNGSGDACGVKLVASLKQFECAHIGLTNISTLTVTDPSNNSSKCSSVITVSDKTAPSAVCKDVTIQLNSNGSYTMYPSEIDFGSSDGCGYFLSADPVTFNCSNRDSLNVSTLTVTDPSNNSSTCSSIITVEDNLAPNASCSNLTITLDSSGNASANASAVNNSSTDACGISTLVLSQTAFNCAHVSTNPNKVTLLVTDANNNSSSCSAMITVQDNIAPMASCKAITVELNAAGAYSLTTTDVGNIGSASSDNCNFILLANPSVFSCSDAGLSVAVTLTATDPGKNTGTCVTTVMVEDNIAPTAKCQDITVQLSSSGTKTVLAADVDNGSDDACIISLALNPASFDCSNIGSTNMVTLTVSDSSKNSSSCDAVITVRDFSAPVAKCQDVTIVLDASGNVTTDAAAVNNGSSDACGISTVVLSKTAFNCAHVSTSPNPVTLTVTDIHSNSSICVSAVTVQDNEAPIASCVDITVDLNSSGNYVLTTTDLMMIGGSSTDNCLLTFSSSPSIFTCLDAGTSVTVTLIASDPGKNTSSCSAVIIVQDKTVPTVSFNVADKCFGEAVAVNNTSSGAVSYQWDFGDSSKSNLYAPVKFYSSAGTYTITLTATSSNKCNYKEAKQVTINPKPVAGFTGVATCAAATAAFVNNSSISSGTMTYNWMFGDGGSSTTTSPNHTYPVSGSYLVMLHVQSALGCRASSSFAINVYDLPVADFNAADVCAGDNTIFVNTSKNGNTAVWTFGDGGTSTQMSPSYKYATTGTFNVSLTISRDGACANVKSKSVTVNANPTAAFTAANGCEGRPISFNNTSTGAVTYQWQFGTEGSDTNASPDFTFNNFGMYTVKLQAYSSQGCLSEISKIIEVYVSPQVSFSVLDRCEGDQTRFLNNSQNGTNFFWNFGDGNTSGSTNPQHQYASAGAYNVTLIVANANCTDSLMQNISINPLPSSDFSFSTMGRDVNFTAAMATAKKYNWNFGDGSKGFIKDPSHHYTAAVAQKYNVCLEVTDNNGCSSETCKEVGIDLLGTKVMSSSDLSLSVYPNPNNGVFHVSCQSGTGHATVVLMSFVGVQVAEATAMNEEVYQFDVGDLTDGVYFVKVSLDGKTSFHRVLIEK